jgi:hypothetical protein
VIGVYDGKTGALLYYIGGLSTDWKTDKGGCVYPGPVGINGNHLYSDCAGYGLLWAWDARKPGKTGGLWILNQGGWGPIATDGKNAIYWASGPQWGYTGLHKTIDEGTLGQTAPYFLNSYTDPLTKTQVNLDDIRGLASAHQGGIYIVQRKYSRIVKFSDTGFGFDYVTSFGSPGKNAEKLEFTAPHDVAISPNGNYIYVIEDGEAISKENTTPGLARIMKFKISYKEEKEIKLTVTP